MKEKFKTKSFWMSVVAAVVLLLQTLGVKINAPYVNQVVESVCALLIVLGIFTAPASSKKTKTTTKSQDDLDNSVSVTNNQDVADNTDK